MCNFADELDKISVPYEARYHALESRYIDPQRRTELLKEAKLNIDQRQGGADIRILYEEAVTRSERFGQQYSRTSEGGHNTKTDVAETNQPGASGSDTL